MSSGESRQRRSSSLRNSNVDSVCAVRSVSAGGVGGALVAGTAGAAGVGGVLAASGAAGAEAAASGAAPPSSLVFVSNVNRCGIRRRSSSASRCAFSAFAFETAVSFEQRPSARGGVLRFVRQRRAGGIRPVVCAGMNAAAGVNEGKCAAKLLGPRRRRSARGASSRASPLRRRSSSRFHRGIRSAPERSACMRGASPRGTSLPSALRLSPHRIGPRSTAVCRSPSRSRHRRVLASTTTRRAPPPRSGSRRAAP